MKRQKVKHIQVSVESKWKSKNVEISSEDYIYLQKMSHDQVLFAQEYR